MSLRAPLPPGVTDCRARIRGGNIHYLAAESGPPLLLLHSLGTSSRAWLKVMETLSRHFAVYAIDMLGHGASDKPKRDYKIEDYARNVVNFMDVLGIRRADIVGNSVGAQVTVEAAAIYPRRVNRVVLAGLPCAETAKERVERWKLAKGQLDETGMPKPRTLEDLAQTYAHPSEELLDWVNLERGKAGPWVGKTLAAVWTHDTIHKLPQITCPSLVVYGDKDALAVKAEVVSKAIERSRLVIIPDAGHLPQMDEPSAFASAVMEFLKAPSPRA